MNHTLSTRRRATRHLLLGSAGIALAAMLMAPQARAQVAGNANSGARVLVSDQVDRARTVSDASGALITIALPGATADVSAILSDNDASAATRGNRANLNLTLDAADVQIDGVPTQLVAGPGGISGSAASLVSSSQRNSGSANGALIMGSRVALDAGDVSDSALAVERNTQETLALGNDNAASLALTGEASTPGAGIVSLQATNGAIETTDDASPVGAHSYGQTALDGGAVTGSALSLSSNLERAIGYGNASTDDLSVAASGLSPTTSSGIASAVPGSADGDATVNASYAVLSGQSLGAAIKARAGHSDTGPAFVANIGGLDGSSLANDGNTLAAAGFGNQSANGIDIGAVSIAQGAAEDGGGGGAVATVTGVQRIAGDGRVIASTDGGAVTDIAEDVVASSVSGSANSAAALAVGNRADGNLLTINAGNIDTPARQTEDGAVGTASVGHDGTATTTAAFSVQNVQDSGQAGISAGQLEGATRLMIGGGISGSSAAVRDNDAAATAIRNDATNGVTIAAAGIRTSADLNSFQTSAGSVTAVLGTAGSPGGAAIAVSGPAVDSSLAMSRNRLAGAATGNSAANTMTVAGTTVDDGSGNVGAQAGMVEDANGAAATSAAATFALANQQQFGVPESGVPTPAVSQVVGRFAAAAEGTARTSLAVDDNAQQSTALGSSAVNRLAVTATSLGGDGSPAPGSALSSLQFGLANIVATSAMEVVAAGAGSASSMSLVGNTNQAGAAINQADNGLSTATVETGGLDTGVAPAEASLGALSAAGDHVLANWQVAAGSAVAIASTQLAADGAADMDESGVSIAGNSTSADAAANRALNSISVAAVSGDTPTVGLVSNQRSSADVGATATTDAALVGTDGAALTSVGGSPIAANGNMTTSLARGNLADNELSLSGTSVQAPMAVSAVAGPGASAQAGGALLNVQVNAGAVSSAASTSYAIPLNAAGTSIAGLGVGVTGNTVSASAYGNAANNAITATSPGGMPGATLVNRQVNSGPVSAQVTGASYRLPAGPGAAILSGAGNQLVATATGNQANSSITAAR